MPNHTNKLDQLTSLEKVNWWRDVCPKQELILARVNSLININI
jgi:hypothetical protein